jgi:hypothetical protein
VSADSNSRFDVSNPDGSPEANPQEESTRLSEGLKSCRTLLESYRVMLTGQSDGDPPELPVPENDNRD